MNRSRSPVQSLPFTDQLLGFGVRDPARICKLCRDLFIAIQFCNCCLVANRNQQLLFSFLTFFGSDERAPTRRDTCQNPRPATSTNEKRRILCREISDFMLGSKEESSTGARSILQATQSCQ